MDQSDAEVLKKVTDPLQGVSLELVVKNPPLAPTPQATSIRGKHDQVIFIDPRRVEPLPFNPRKRNSPGFTSESLRVLGSAIKLTGQLQACSVCRSTDPNFDAKLIDGERRFLACKMAGIMLLVVVNEKIDPNDEETLHALSVAHNFNREPHTCIEVAHAVSRMKIGAKMDAEDIAIAVGKTSAWVYQHLSLLRLHQSVQEMLVTPPEKNNKRSYLLSFSIGIMLTNEAYSQEEQLGLANEIVKSQMSDAEARRFLDNELRKKGLSTKTRTGPKKLFTSLHNLADKAEHTFGRYLDMTAQEITKMVSSQTPEARSELAKKIRIVGTSLQGLADVIAGKKIPPKN